MIQDSSIAKSRCVVLALTTAFFAIQAALAQSKECLITISLIPDQTYRINTDTDIIEFSVNDARRPTENLVASASTDNQDLLPDSNIQFAPIDPNNGSLRQFICRPKSDHYGIAHVTITVKNRDGCVASTTFKLTVINPAVAITTIPDQTIPIGGSTGPIAFRVSDPLLPPDSLKLEASSSNKTFIPDANIVFGGSGATRTVTVSSPVKTNGDSVITITVKDLSGQTNSTSFLVTTPVVCNGTTTISALPNQVTPPNKATSALPFKVADGCDQIATLTVAGRSSNQTLVPDANIVFGGTGMNRTVIITPAKNKSGTTIIIITATSFAPVGASTSASTSFTLTVAAPGPPTISSIPNQTSYVGELENRILTFSIGNDAEDGASLMLSAQSSNQSLIPDKGIVFSGSGTRRTLLIQPTPNQVGTTAITITVISSGGLASSTTFEWTVLNQPPRILSPQITSSGDFHFLVNGMPSERINLVQTSPDLKEWVTLYTNSLSKGAFQFVDTVTNRNHRFYRVMVAKP